MMTNKQLRRKLEDTLSGLVVVRVADGLKIRRKRGPKREQVLKAPEFEGSRGSLGDFVHASRSAKLLRNSIAESLLHVQDRGMYNRLTSVMSKVVKADLQHAAGSRRVAGGDPGLLSGFEFNAKSALGTTLLADHRIHLNKSTGEVVVDVPSFNASALVYAPPGATHFILHASASAVDFDSRHYDNAHEQSALIPIDAVATGELKFNMKLPAGKSLPTFVAFGICFVQHVHNVTYPLMNSSYNALQLTVVDDEQVSEVSQQVDVAVGTLPLPMTATHSKTLQSPRPKLKTWLGSVERFAARKPPRRNKIGDG